MLRPVGWFLFGHQVASEAVNKEYGSARACFFIIPFMLVARVGSESAMFLPYMDRFTFMFRCCFAFLCTFSSAQFLFYLYPAQFERDGVLSLWYSSLAFKTVPDIPIFTFQRGTVKQVPEFQYDGDFSIGQELVGYIHCSPNHKLILFGRYTGRAWNHHGMLQHVNQQRSNNGRTFNYLCWPLLDLMNWQYFARECPTMSPQFVRDKSLHFWYLVRTARSTLFGIGAASLASFGINNMEPNMATYKGWPPVISFSCSGKGGSPSFACSFAHKYIYQ